MNSPLPFQQTLKQLGFSDNEIKVLLFLLHTKKSTAQNISWKTGIPVDTTQYCLSNLSAQEIIHAIPNQENVFEIISQSEFFEWIEKVSRRTELNYENSKNKIKKFLFEIQGGLKKQGIECYKGRTEILEIYEDILKSKNKNMYTWLDINNMYKNLGNSYLMNFIDRRMKKEIKVHAIMPINKKNLEHESRDEGRDAKFLEEFLVNNEIRIYDEKIAIIDYKKAEPTGIVLREGMINQSFRNFFQNTWTQVKGDRPSFYQVSQNNS